MANPQQRWDQTAGGAAFRTTLWPVVERARQGDTEAFAELYRVYARPLYCFFRCRGLRSEDAKDAVQSLFANLYEKDGFARVTATKGRLRTWLLSCAGNLLSDEVKRQRAQKRGGGIAPVSFDELAAEAQFRAEPVSPQTAEAHYDRNWAQATSRTNLSP
jgi:RNA polymerase sigma-70 factor (ECF subfamily)